MGSLPPEHPDQPAAKSRRTGPEQELDDRMLHLLLSVAEDARESLVDQAVCAFNSIASQKDIRKNARQPVPEEPDPADPATIHFNAWKTYTDTKTGSVLDPEAVRQAMVEEIKFMRGIPVWQPIDRPGPGDSRPV